MKNISKNKRKPVSTHKFFKDNLGLSLFVLTYLAISLQVSGVYCTPFVENRWQVFHNILFYLIAALACISHFRASYQDPGKITYESNPSMIWHYIKTHGESVLVAEELNRRFHKQFFEDDKEDHSDTESEGEDELYQATTSVSDDVVKKLTNEYKINAERCRTCYVVRVPKTHHCKICQGCFIRMDHHCPWINNCVGQFNQKFFILFCFYCMIGCTYAAIYTSYYFIYLNNLFMMRRFKYLLLILLQLIFSVTFIIFTATMLYDQWTTINQDSTLIDLKQKKIIEKRTVSEVLEEVFSESFSIGWFLPIKSGGRKFILDHINAKIKDNDDADKKND